MESNNNVRDLSPNPAKRYASILKKHKKTFSFGKANFVEDKPPVANLPPLHKNTFEIYRRESLENVVIPKKLAGESTSVLLKKFNVQSVIKCQSYIKRWLAVKHFRNQKIQWRKRTDIVNNLCSSEKIYINNLKTLIEVFVRPLKSTLEWTNPCLSRENFRLIFSEIEVIVFYNGVFLDSLTKTLEFWDPLRTKLDIVFVIVADLFRLYQRYINNLCNSIFTLQKLKKETKLLSNFLEKNSQLPRCGKNSLEDFLMLPLKRTNEYISTLQDLIDNTWKEHPDYDGLISVQNRVLEVVEPMQEEKKKSENLAKILHIESLVAGISNEFSLVSRNRYFIREGNLVKADEDGKQNICHFFLFSDIILWTRFNNRPQLLEHILPLSTIDIREEDFEGKLAFSISTDKTKAILFAPTENDTKSWLTEITSHRLEIYEKESSKLDPKKLTLQQKDLKEKKEKEFFRKKKRSEKDLKEKRYEKDFLHLLTERVESTSVIESNAKDPDLWNILTLVLNGLDIKEEVVHKILTGIESYIETTPTRSKTLQTINKIFSTSKSFMEINMREIAAIKIQSIARGWKVRKYVRELRANCQGNLLVRNESFRNILRLERDYCRKLEIVVKDYLYPLRNWLTKKERGLTLNHGDLASIFSTIEPILECHQTLLSKYEELNKKWPNLDTIGRNFMSVVPSFSNYIEYTKNFKTSFDAFTRCQKEQKFANFCEEVSERTGERGFDLMSLLTCPLNHISLHIKNFLTIYKNTPPSHSDFKHLVNSYSVISQLSTFIQQSISDADNQAAIANIRSRIEVTDQKLLDLFGGPHKFLREGPVTLIKPPKKKETRYLFLFSNQCLVTEQTKKNFRYKQIFLLAEEKGVKLEDVPDSVSKASFKITGNFDEETGGKISIIFAWKNNEEKESWYKDMDQVIHNSHNLHQKNIAWTLIPQERQGFSLVFNQLDTNTDGFISFEEFADSIKDYNFKPDLISKICNLSDARSKDKQLDVQEFCAAMFLVTGSVQSKQLPDEIPSNLWNSISSLESEKTIVPEEISPPVSHKDSIISDKVKESPANKEKYFHIQRKDEEILIPLQRKRAMSQDNEHKLDEFQKILIDYCNQVLSSETKISDRLPIGYDQREIAKATLDGVLISILINLTVPNTIDERVIIWNTKTLDDIRQNHQLCLNAAIGIGISTTFSSKEWLKGDTRIITTFIADIIQYRLFLPITSMNQSAKNDLSGGQPDIFIRMPPEEILLLWVNFYLKKTKQKPITNFSEDLKDSSVYVTLLNEISSGNCDQRILEEQDLKKRAEFVIQCAEKLNCKGLITPKEIVNGNSKLNIFFLANLFGHSHEIKRTSLSKIFSIKDNISEEKTLCHWMNYIGIPIKTLSQDLRDGLFLFRLFEQLHFAVDWNRVNKDPKIPAQRISNCAYALELAKKIGWTTSVDANGLAAGNLKSSITIIHEGMRQHLFSSLKTKFGKDLNEKDILSWANKRSSIKILTFADPSLKSSKYLAEVLSHLYPSAVEMSIIKIGPTVSNEDLLSNARYVISSARRCGVCVFLSEYDILEVNEKLIFHFVGSIILNLLSEI